MGHRNALLLSLATGFILLTSFALIRFESKPNRNATVVLLDTSTSLKPVFPRVTAAIEDTFTVLLHQGSGTLRLYVFQNQTAPYPAKEIFQFNVPRLKVPVKQSQQEALMDFKTQLKPVLKTLKLQSTSPVLESLCHVLYEKALQGHNHSYTLVLISDLLQSSSHLTLSEFLVQTNTDEMLLHKMQALCKKPNVLPEQVVIVTYPGLSRVGDQDAGVSIQVHKRLVLLFQSLFNGWGIQNVHIKRIGGGS